ncbi:uncharacterized protein LOC113238563 [Hyposmocoma kahamanoa]|uniref:uncharacterized protein LOC113238563 n=1 Tax=Hyposmocoma kahamanoa TaxID=1477025 RepID=UPI000E6D678B|nr:uncharacterized protein LOC113238563 [Hyposmocoma kahamanoa]
MEVRILSDCESEGERMVSASSDVEPTLSEGNSRAVSRSGSAREEESSRAPKRAAPSSNESMEPERTRPVGADLEAPGSPSPVRQGEGAPARQSGTPSRRKRQGQAGESEPDGMAGLMRETLAQEARDGLAAILAETAKSSNLKGTVVKAIKEAVIKVEGAVDFLHRGETATEAARRMSEDNRRMWGQLAALETEVKALRGAYSSAMAKAKAQMAPPPCSSAEMHAGVREAIDDLRRDIFSSMRNMIDARLGDIERCLPAEYLRPPLGSRTGAPAPEATPAAIAVAAAAPERPNKKAKRKATATPPAAPPAVLAVPTAPDAAASTLTYQAETPWSQVVGHKPRKAKTAAAAPQAARAPAKAAPKTAPRPRALATPKSSAVVITLRPEAVAEKGATYKGVLEAATAAVDLGSLGIPHVRVRNTQTGVRIVEVSVASSAQKADTLAAKLEEVIGWLAAEIGHTRALCPSSVDRSGLCFRCGLVGHSASGCTATPRCSVCIAARRPADHVMGGRSCAPPPTKGKRNLSPPPPLLLRDKGNLNHYARAQDLLVQAMAEWGVAVAAVAEPYIVPPRGNWAGDREETVAIVASTAGNSHPLVVKERGSGFVAARWGEAILIGVYFSPNRSLAQFQAFLETLERAVRRAAPTPVLVLGDLNAKSAAWGSPVTNARGPVLEDWAAALGLVVLNWGHANTCVRRNGGSIVSIT